MAFCQEGFDELLYSRQLYVIGNEAMSSLGRSHVLLYHLGGLGVEIAKNLVLMGIKNLTLQDPKLATLKDLGTNIFITSEDVHLQRNRAEVCLPHLQDMNQYVSLNSRSESLEDCLDFTSLLNYQVVVLTECDLDVQVSINNFCRSQDPPIKFISADVYGVFSFLFCDFGDNFIIKDYDGEEPKEILIGNISKENPVIVTTADNKRHGLQSGDVVSFWDIVGMKALNGTSATVTVLSPSTFSIGDMTGNCGVYQRGGFCRLEKEPTTLHFESLEKQLKKPSLLLIDYGKEQVAETIHLGILLLHKFRRKKGRLPNPRDGKDAQSFINMAKKVMSECEINIESLDMELLKHLSYTAEGQLYPLVAFLGGVAAQEVVKALTLKFTPLRQWVYLDAAEISSEASDVDLVLRNDRYDSLRICVGNDICDKLTHTKLFMVGCGAVGCEMLKNYAMLGIATVDGLVTITDDDLIEKSNLSRQFLYRSHHLQQHKSVIASKAVHPINPDMKIEAHQHRVSPTTEEIYSESFFQTQDLIVNALDNVETRRYMDKRCIQSSKPMLESGTMGCKGHVQVVVPHLTEHYSSQSDPRDEEYPYCTIKSFPSQIEHAVQWARDKFESLFVEKPFLFNQLCKKYENMTEIIQKLEEGHKMQEAAVITKMLATRPRDWGGCISLARLKFEKYFNHKAQQLLHTFPLDANLNDGSLFWQSPKRPPNPLQFSLNDEMSCMFVISLAQLLAVIWGIPYSEMCMTSDMIADIVLHTQVPQFTPNLEKVVVTDENAEKPVKFEKDQNVENVTECITVLKQIALEISDTIRMFPQHFEKDNSGVQMNFITAAANLRASMYGIEPASQMKIKQIAGKIIPAIATTTSSVAGLVSLELLKVIKGEHGRERYRNCFLNLAIPYFVFSEPGPPHITSLAPDISFTVWDRWEMHGTPEMNLQQFLDLLNQRTGLPPTMLVCGTKMIWIPLFPKHEKRKTETMLALLKPAPNQTYVDLAVAFETMTGDENVGPPVRYYFNTF